MSTELKITLDEALPLAEQLRDALSHGPAQCRGAGLVRDTLALLHTADDFASRISNLALSLRP